MSYSSLFRHSRVGYVNLNDAAIWWRNKERIPPNAPTFIDPDVTERMKQDIHRELNIDASYGGWQEDRSSLWIGTYLGKHNLWCHTGVDANLRQDTTVDFLALGEIVYIGDDTPLVGGWGGHVIQKITFRHATHALIYAHLELNKNLKVGQIVDTDDQVGVVGSKEKNGFWFPHLHLQLFAEIGDVVDWKAFSQTMDGYVKLEDRWRWARMCPDPTPLLFA